MKKLLDVVHGKLINIIGRHGNLDQYSWMSVIPLNDHLCSKLVKGRLALLIGFQFPVANFQADMEVGIKYSEVGLHINI